jgi:hypothetical protein
MSNEDDAALHPNGRRVDLVFEGSTTAAAPDEPSAVLTTMR